MANYDLIGNVAIVKFDRSVKTRKKKKWALDFLKRFKNVSTVLEKSDRFKGRLRTQKTKYLAGVKTKEALYRENECVFRFNVDSCYFSQRLASERKEIASFVKKGENVLVMFGGVAPFAILFAYLGVLPFLYQIITLGIGVFIIVIGFIINDFFKKRSLKSKQR